MRGRQTARDGRYREKLARPRGRFQNSWIWRDCYRTFPVESILGYLTVGPAEAPKTFRTVLTPASGGPWSRSRCLKFICAKTKSFQLSIQSACSTLRGSDSSLRLAIQGSPYKWAACRDQQKRKEKDAGRCAGQKQPASLSLAGYTNIVYTGYV
jgi:hypothetical protein